MALSRVKYIDDYPIPNSAAENIITFVPAWRDARCAETGDGYFGFEQHEIHVDIISS